MANKSGSNSNDLYVGAGKWYTYPWVDGIPQRDDLTMIGDVGSATLSTNITSIEHKSSMDQAREVMASINTETTQKLTLELYEFDPVNLAIGLYGKDGIVEQVAGNKTKQYKISPNMNIRLMDDDGNPYMNVSDIVINRVSAKQAKVEAAQMTSANGSTGTVTSGGTYTGIKDTTYYIRIDKANTVAGTVTDCEFAWGKGSSSAIAFAAAQKLTATGTAQTLDDGVTVALTLGSTDSFVVGEIYSIDVKAAGGKLVEGVDYVVNEVDIRGGIINIPATAKIDDDTEVLVAFNVPAMKAPKIMGGTIGKIERGLLFIGDPNIGPCYNMEIWKAAIKPNGDVGLIGTDFASFQLECTLLSDRANHPTEPLYTMAKVKAN